MNQVLEVPEPPGPVKKYSESEDIDLNFTIKVVGDPITFTEVLKSEGLHTIPELSLLYAIALEPDTVDTTAPPAEVLLVQP